MKLLKLFTLIFEATCGQAVVYRSTFDLFKFSYLLLVLPCVTSCVVVCRHTIFLYNDLFFGRLWPHLKKKLSTYIYIALFFFFQQSIHQHLVSMGSEFGILGGFSCVRSLVLGQIHLPLMDGPFVNCVTYKIFLFFIRI